MSRHDVSTREYGEETREMIMREAKKKSRREDYLAAAYEWCPDGGFLHGDSFHPATGLEVGYPAHADSPRGAVRGEDDTADVRQ